MWLRFQTNRELSSNFRCYRGSCCSNSCENCALMGIELVDKLRGFEIWWTLQDIQDSVINSRQPRSIYGITFIRLGNSTYTLMKHALSYIMKHTLSYCGTHPITLWNTPYHIAEHNVASYRTHSYYGTLTDYLIMKHAIVMEHTFFRVTEQSLSSYGTHPIHQVMKHTLSS